MNTGILVVGKFVFIGMLYLFFARVLRAVWVELHPDRANRSRAKRRAQKLEHQEARKKHKAEQAKSEAPGALRVARSTPKAIRISDSIDATGSKFALTDNELTIGRAPGCAIRLDDSYASQLHTRVFLENGKRYAEDLGSTNGTLLNGAALTAPKEVQTGDTLRIGGTSLEFVR